MARRALSKRETEASENLRRIWDSQKTELRLTQEMAAFRFGWKTQGAVSQYLLGRIPLNTDATLKFAELLQVEPLEIDPYLKLPKRYSEVREAVGGYYVGVRGKLPLISWVQAGQWSEIVDAFQPGDAEDWLPCPVVHGPHAYIVRVEGDSMHNPDGKPSFADGDLIFVDPDVGAEHRRCVIVRLEDEQKATFKQLVIEGDRKYLKALNPAWPNRIIEVNKTAYFCGVVIGKFEPI